jgi:hypothetical protein
VAGSVGLARYRIGGIRYRPEVGDLVTRAFGHFNHPNLALACPVENLAEIDTEVITSALKCSE